MSHLTLPTVYPITDRVLSGLSHSQQVVLLAEAGASLVQLREKRLTPREFHREAVEAVRIGREYGVRIIINDRVDIALASRADGVHLGQSDLLPGHARRLLGDEAIIGYSTHSLRQLEDALRQPVDYIAIGPVFPTVTKENPDPAVGTELVRAAAAMCGKLPVVAIGGITEANLAEVIAAGASSVAVIGAILNDPVRIKDAYKSLMERTLGVKHW
jgi:thiamine-phosphate pyrophosphorylase